MGMDKIQSLTIPGETKNIKAKFTKTRGKFTDLYNCKEA